MLNSQENTNPNAPPSLKTLSREALLHTLKTTTSLTKEQMVEVIDRALFEFMYDEELLNALYAASNRLYAERRDFFITSVLVHRTKDSVCRLLQFPSLRKRIEEVFGIPLMLEVSFAMQPLLVVKLIELNNTNLSSLIRTLSGLICMVLVLKLGKRKDFLLRPDLVSGLNAFFTNDRGEICTKLISKVLVLLPRNHWADFLSGSGLTQKLNQAQVDELYLTRNDFTQIESEIYPPGLIAYGTHLFIKELEKYLKNESVLTEDEIQYNTDLLEVLKDLDPNDWDAFLNLPCIQSLWDEIKDHEALIKKSLVIFSSEKCLKFLTFPMVYQKLFPPQGSQVEPLFKNSPDIIYVLLNAVDKEDWNELLNLPGCIKRLKHDIERSIVNGESVFMQIRSAFDSSEQFTGFLSKKAMSHVLRDVVGNAFYFSVLLHDYSMSERWKIIAHENEFQKLYIRFIIHDNPAPIFDRLVIEEGAEEHRRAVAEITEAALDTREALPKRSSAQHHGTTIFSPVPQTNHRRFLHELNRSLQGNPVIKTTNTIN